MGNTKCPVCETSMELQTDFCPKCGFQRHILPNGVSDKVQADENERIAKAKEFYEAYEAAKSAADNAKAAADKEMQSKLDEANKALEDEKKAHEKTESDLEDEKAAHKETKSDLENEKTAHERTKSNLAKEQTAHNRTQDALKDEEAAHERTKSNLAKEQTAHNRTQDALKDEEAAHERTKSNLAKEQTAHNRTKDALKDEEAAHEETKKKLDDTKKNLPTQTTPPNPGGANRGNLKAILEIQGRSYNLYEGENVFMSPCDIKIAKTGNLFNIIIRNDVVTLFDLCGETKQANGRSIRTRGNELFDGDIFTIGEIDCTLSISD